MFDTATLTISGNVVADPKVTGVSDSPDRVSFRVISNHRRRDKDTGEWAQAGQYAMNVVCWRKLARGVANSIHKGDPVLVTGRMTERKFTGSDGEEHWHTEVVADFVGTDLGQGIAGRFTRFTQLDRVGQQMSESADGSAAVNVDADVDAGGTNDHDDPPADGFDADATEVFNEAEPQLSAS